MECLSSGSGEDGADETWMEYAPPDSLVQEVQRGYELMGKLQSLLDQNTCTDAQIILARAILEEAVKACNASLCKLMPRDGIKVEAQTANVSTSHDPVSCSFDANESDHGTSMHPDSWQVVTITPYHDGHEWRKYGEKKISGFPFPRCYYRCTYKEEQGCPARKQVQQQNCDDPPLFMVTYRKEHTCSIRSSPASYRILLQATNVDPPPQPFVLQFESQECCVNNYLSTNRSPPAGTLNTNMISSRPQSLQQASSTGFMAVKGVEMANQSTLVLGGMLHNDEYTFCGQWPSSSQQLLAFDAGYNYVMVEESGCSELNDMEISHYDPLIGLW